MEARHPSDVIGNWGPMQQVTFIVLSFTCIMAPFSNSGTYLYTPKLNFKCHYYDSDDLLINLNNTCSYNNSLGQETKCTNFSYDHSFYTRTLIEQFDMVCDHSWYSSFSLSIHQIGYGISGVAIGYLSDRYGRLFAARASIILEIFAGFGQAFAPTMYWFWFSRLFIGIAAYGRFLTGYVLIMEWIGPKYRATCTILYDIGWQIGYTILLIYYYTVPDYKIIQISASLFEILILMIFCLTMNESPRWLMTHDRMEEAEKLLTKAAKPSLSEAEAKKRVASVVRHAKQEISEEKNVKDQTVIDIWKVPILLKLSLILYYTWFAHAFIGYASFFSTESLSGNVFMNLTIVHISDCVCFLVIAAVFNRLPRKNTLIWGMFAEVIGISFMLTASLSATLRDYMMIPNIFFRSCITLVAQMYYLYTAETFPTTMRQASMGMCSIFARVGSTSAPFVRELTAATSLSFTICVFLTFTLINLILVLFIPDTGKIEIADTIGQKKKEVETVQHRSGSIVSALSLHL